MRFVILLLLAGVFLVATFVGGLTHSIVADWLRRAPPDAAYWLGGGVVSLLAGVWWYRQKRQPTGNGHDAAGD